jgi:hypothetical protein
MFNTNLLISQDCFSQRAFIHFCYFEAAVHERGCYPIEFVYAMLFFVEKNIIAMKGLII